MREFNSTILESQVIDLLRVEIERITTYDKNNIATWKIFLVLLIAYIRIECDNCSAKDDGCIELIFSDELTQDIVCLVLNNSVVGEYLSDLSDVSEYDYTQLYDRLVCGEQTVKCDGDFLVCFKRELIQLYKDNKDTMYYALFLLFDYAGFVFSNREILPIVKSYMYSDKDSLIPVIDSHNKSFVGAFEKENTPIGFCEFMEKVYKEIFAGDFESLVYFFDINELVKE